MKRKIILGIIFCIILFIIGYLFIINLFFNNNVSVKNEEIIPEAEISDFDARKTMITLYFLDNESGKLAKESRIIDSKELLLNPYEKLINMLILGPKDPKLKKVIPENTKLINAKLEGKQVIADFSEEINKDVKNEDLENIAVSIINTLTELKEVDSVKFLINGKEEGSLNKFDRKSIQ